MRKLEILQRKEPRTPRIRKASDPVISDTTSRGIRQTGMKRSDAAMLITNTSIVFFIAFVLKKTRTRRKFPSSETMAMTLYSDTLVIVAAGVLIAAMEQWVSVEFLLKFATSVVLFIMISAVITPRAQCFDEEL